MQNFPNEHGTKGSDIGCEKRCPSCGEYWPADNEFFAAASSSRDGLARRCLACVKERVWAFVVISDG